MNFVLRFLYLLGLSSSTTALTLIDPVNKTQFFIDPQTLAAYVMPVEGTKIEISSALDSGQVSDIKQTNSKTQWQRNDVQIEAAMEGGTFVVRFARATPGYPTRG